MKVSFATPLSNSRVWQGQFHVDANVDGQEVEVSRVIYEDPSGRRANVTHLIDEWCGNLYTSLCDAAINAVEEPITDDYTLNRQ